MLGAVRALTDRLIGLSAMLGMLGLLFVVGIVLVDVIGRAFGNPLYGSLDMTTMTFVVVVFCGMALCDQQGGHISVDLFERFFPPRLNHLIDIVVDLLGGAIFLTMAYAVMKTAQLSAMLNLKTNLLGLPLAWFQWLLVVLAILTGAAVLLRALDLMLSGRSFRQGGQVE